MSGHIVYINISDLLILQKKTMTGYKCPLPKPATPLHYKTNEMTAEEIYSHFITCNIPPNGLDLMAFAQKIRANAVTVEAYCADTLVGFCACYMNDLTTRTAYITHIAIVPAYRSCGYGKQLLEQTINTARELGFVRICLEVLKTNTPAFQMYQSFHFHIIADHISKWLMSRELSVD